MGIDNLRELKYHNVKESLNGISAHSLEGVPLVSISLMFSPKDILENIVLVEMNKNTNKEKLEVTSFGEFIDWIRIWVLCLLSLVSGALISGTEKTQMIWHSRQRSWHSSP